MTAVYAEIRFHSIQATRPDDFARRIYADGHDSRVVNAGGAGKNPEVYVLPRTLADIARSTG
jgi:hypothetical protein